MRSKQALSTSALFIIVVLNFTNGIHVWAPRGDSKRLPSDPSTYCQILTNGNECTVGGNSCNNFPSNYNCNGSALYLKYSSIVQIRQGDFDNLAHLKSLTLDMNSQLQNIEQGVFTVMSELKNLTITNSVRLMYIDSETFAGLINLQYLDLSKNGLIEFYRISQAVTPGILLSIVSLDLSGNPLRCINYTDAYHMNSSTLEILRLSSCSISHIEGNAFNNLLNLKKLFIDYNNLPTGTIIDVMHNITANSDKFSEIHIGANNVPDPNAIFSQVGDTRISRLDLSFSRFVPVIAGNMYTLPRIVYLDLSVTRSRLPEIYFTAAMFPNIEYLYLSNNCLLGRQFSMSLPKLQFLDLSNNVDSKACVSIFSSGFVLNNMTSLKVLRLDSNPITSLNYGSFLNLSNLMELYLSNTSIQYFGIAPFSGLGSLEVLDLSNNIFTEPHTINNSTLTGLGNLKTLILDGSMLTCLEDDNTFNHTPKLQYLSIKQNTLLQFHHALLLPVPQLNVLDLSYNNFQSWDLRLFENNKNLETLNLCENEISTFTSAMLQDFSGLKQLYLVGNALSCYCSDISNIFPYINTSLREEDRALVAAISQPDIFCSVPEDLRFSSFWETAEKLRSTNGCRIPNTVEFILTLVAICSCLGILIATPAIYFLRWHIKYWIFLMRQALSCHIFPKRKADVPLGKYLYDAFVSYSNEDRGFVVRLVSMLENQAPRFRLCVFERDFAVGGVITDSVVESLGKSKRTLLILSDAFARSTWCQWEMNLAQHKRLFFKDDQNGPLIIIKIGEIMEKHMTPTLRYLTKTRIYLQWNSDPIKQKLFWQKLRSALAAPLNNEDDDDRPALRQAVLNDGNSLNKSGGISLNYTTDSIIDV